MGRRDEEHYCQRLRELKGPLIEHVSELASVCDITEDELAVHAELTGTLVAKLSVAAFRLGRESMRPRRVCRGCIDGCEACT